MRRANNRQLRAQPFKKGEQRLGGRKEDYALGTLHHSDFRVDPKGFRARACKRRERFR